VGGTIVFAADQPGVSLGSTSYSFLSATPRPDTVEEFVLPNEFLQLLPNQLRIVGSAYVLAHSA
jgi:hypothetical protein